MMTKKMVMNMMVMMTIMIPMRMKRKEKVILIADKKKRCILLNCMT